MKRIGYIDGRRLFLADGQALSFGTDKDIAVSFNASLDALEFAGHIYLPTGKNLLLASGGVINFGNGDVIIRHSSGRLTITKALLVSGELSVSQDLTVGNNSIINGNLNVGGTFRAGGTATCAGTLNVSGDFTVGPTGETQILGITRLAAEFIYVNNIPTSDPGGSGRLWNNSGVMTISA